MGESRDALLRQIWNAQDESYDLMYEYDTLPHYYGNNILYQAEGQIIDLIADYPGITITELGTILKKTASACSQIVHKLREKDWVVQTRNRKNNRQYNLVLTEAGMQVYRAHRNFCHSCQLETFRMLNGFSEEILEHYLLVQEKINEAYRADVKRSREQFTRHDAPTQHHSDEKKQYSET